MSAAEIPFDLSGLQESLAGKKRLAELLTQRSMTPAQGQMVSGHYVSPGILGHIAPVLQALMAGSLNKDVQVGQADLASKYRDMTKQGLDNYFTTREGAPGTSSKLSLEQADALMGSDVMPPEGRQADPRRAAIEALTSQIPMLQELGKMDLLAKPQKPDYSNIKEAGGRFYDLASGAPVEIGGNEFGETVRIGGDLYQRGPGGKLVKLDNAPKVSTQVSVDARQPVVGGAKKYYENYGESIAPGGKSKLAAEAASEALTASSEAVTAITDGARQGIAQPAMQVVRKLAAELGIENSDTAPTEALSSALSSATFKELGGLGAQISNSDRDFVKSFSGDLATDPKALKRMLAIRLAVQAKRVNTHNKLVESFARKNEDPTISQEAGVPLNLTIPDPEIAAMFENVMQGKPSTLGLPQFTSPGKLPPAGKKKVQFLGFEGQ